MDVFHLRNTVIDEYAEYIKSFVTIRDDDIRSKVEEEFGSGLLWPEPLIQLNPSFEQGPTLQDLVDEGTLHPECLQIFRKKEEEKGELVDSGPLRLHKHQVDSIRVARNEQSYVLTTGTGSGKSLSYIVPIVDHVLRNGSGKGIQAIIVYPMNALANSQLGELKKFLQLGYPAGKPPVTFRRYTGQESKEEKKEIQANPPDILLTNYVMLELILTRTDDAAIVRAAEDLRFLVLDELHTYRGRQGSDVSMLVRRTREACKAKNLLNVGTSATLSTEGSWPTQQKEVADLATKIFGSQVLPESVIGETLRRTTAPIDLDQDPEVQRLRERVAKGSPPDSPQDFLKDPLASWIETTFGLGTDPDTEALIRSMPQALHGKDGAGARLARVTGLTPEQCEVAIEETLLKGYSTRDAFGRPIFAFRLHQFVSKGETVFASPEEEDDRHITLQMQQFVPGSHRKKVLLPLAFCRECGQEYYVVRKSQDRDGIVQHIPRDLSQNKDDEDGDAGFLYINTKDPWPEDPSEELDRLPDDWLEIRNDRRRVRDARRDRVPVEVFLSADGKQGQGSLRAHYMPAPFLFCMRCGVSYQATQRSDFGKLASLGTEGRSSATTVLTLSTIRSLREADTLAQEARKILSFSDNRQDASLQAGHFNDFVEVGLIRSGLFHAVKEAGSGGLRHDSLPNEVFRVLKLPRDLYAVNPTAEYLGGQETDKALRRVLAYYLYRDLRRGWRVTSPNLEQCGLLKIEYASLREFSGDEQHWEGLHPALASATPEQRVHICEVLLDYLRRELAIRVDVLDSEEQEKVQRRSDQHLVDPWRLDPDERLETSRIAFPRSQSGNRSQSFVWVSPRGGFGYFIKRPGVLNVQDLKTEDIGTIIAQLFEVLTVPGLMHRVLEPREDGQVPGYQLNAAGMVWRPGDGSEGFHDHIRVPSPPESGPRTNPYFVDFYGSPTEDLPGLEAHEHTAQVPYYEREEREERFREGRLPVLFCSPTMELGVDIAQLNVVGMRNVPPTPANYAQRSGRAGRSGQPAFVYTYCAAGSPHDQYFFRRAGSMVGGQVTPPRLDLTNEELLRAHVHAIWLSSAGLHLGSSLRDILDVSGDHPSLEVLPEKKEKLNDQAARVRALSRAEEALGPTVQIMLGADGVARDWLQRELDAVPQAFADALKRWRGLYRAAFEQAKNQSAIARDASRPPEDRKKAKQLRAEAEAQLSLLLETSVNQQSDFYSYRYFASEGFLPGYNFPRLPLSAFIPGRRRTRGTDEFLSRPRFLAISEFGPRSYVYHEGSRYVTNKVILPVDRDETSLTRRASRCQSCGYIHPLGEEPAPDLCESCSAPLPTPMDNLFRMENVATRRRDRITSDEEERQRLGFELETSVRFATRDGRESSISAEVIEEDGSILGTLKFGSAATLWRTNLGWRRRARQEETGFVLDLERGYWQTDKALEEEDQEDPLSPRLKRVVPYVEDRKNCLLVNIPEIREMGPEGMASLGAALKVGIQAHFQLEDSELMAEALPSSTDRNILLLFEAAEGGAGVLQRLVEDHGELRAVAKEALEICHFDPATREDTGAAEGASETCEAACYDCLLSYYNQRDHRLLDRHLIAPILHRLTSATLRSSPKPQPRDEQLKRLRNLAQSSLEQKWLNRLEALNLHLPSAAQVVLTDFGVQPDFAYEGKNGTVLVFIDGPSHDHDEMREEDRKKRETLELAGYFVLTFRYDDDWDALFRANAGVFGEPMRTGSDEGPASTPAGQPDTRDRPESGSELDLDLDLFDDRWHPLLSRLSDFDLTIEPGEDIMSEGRIVGSTVGALIHTSGTVHLVAEEGSGTKAVIEALEAQGKDVIQLSGDPERDLSIVREYMGV